MPLLVHQPFTVYAVAEADLTNTLKCGIKAQLFWRWVRLWRAEAYDNTSTGFRPGRAGHYSFGRASRSWEADGGWEGPGVGTHPQSKQEPPNREAFFLVWREALTTATKRGKPLEKELAFDMKSVAVTAVSIILLALLGLLVIQEPMVVGG